MRLQSRPDTASIVACGIRHAALSLGLFASLPSSAQTGGAAPVGTAPATVIANTAEVRWTAAGAVEAGRSNTDRLIVAERLDIRLARDPAAPADATATAIALTNAGTGNEAFAIVAILPDDPASPLPIVVDVDGDGRCDPAIDRPLADGRTAPLAAGAGVRLLVCGAGADLRVTARAVTGSGTPGTAFTGAGDDGSDAVIGPTGAAATLVIGADGGPGASEAAPFFAKSQSVVAPDGSARATVGAVITYTLDARFDAATTDVAIDDPLPAGTAIVAGSLALDGHVLSDAADADAGEIDAGTVRVRLGDVPAGAAHRVTFSVTVTA